MIPDAPGLGARFHACVLHQLRAYPNWQETVPPRPRSDDDSGFRYDVLESDTIVYLRHDYVVTLGILPDSPVVFDRVTPDWKAFVAEHVGFAG